MFALEAKAEQAEKERDAEADGLTEMQKHCEDLTAQLEEEKNVSNKLDNLQERQRVEIAELQKQNTTLHEQLNHGEREFIIMTQDRDRLTVQNAELERKLKSSEDIRHAEKEILLDEISQNARMKEALEWVIDSRADSLTKQRAIDALQQLSNQGDETK
jgi:hypothetical protein